MMRRANEFMKEKKSFVEEQVQEYAKKKLSIFSEAIDKAWDDKMEFFKVGKIIMVDETKKLYDVESEIQRRFGGNEKEAQELCDRIMDRSNIIAYNLLKGYGWKCETDAEMQKIQNLDYIPYCLVPIEKNLVEQYVVRTPATVLKADQEEEM